MASVRAVPAITGFTIAANSVSFGSTPLAYGETLRAAYLAAITTGSQTGVALLTGYLQLALIQNTALTDGTQVIMNLDQGNLYETFQAQGGAPVRGNALEWEGNFTNSGYAIIYVQACVLNDMNYAVGGILTTWIQPRG